MTTIGKKEWERWEALVPEGRFRVSVKMYCGKKMNLKYRYVNFSQKVQLKNWLTLKGQNVVEIVNIFEA